MYPIESFKILDFDKAKGKTVLVRADLNSSVKNGKILKSPKVIAHADTVFKLARNRAKVVVLSHQGRKGREDFISLEPHCKALSELIGKEAGFCTWKEPVEKRIKALKDGDVLLLDNTRFLDFETENKTPKEHAARPEIAQIAKNADLFVLDALSVAHRGHATVTGFTPLLERYAGPVLVREIKALQRMASVIDNTTLVLGGVKPDDSIALMEKMLKRGSVKRVLLGGGLGELAIRAKGQALGKKDTFIKEKGLERYVKPLGELLETYKDEISMPVDLAIKKYGHREEISLAELPSKHDILDIGEITAQNYEHKIQNSDFVILNGPVGKFEDYQFAYGTRKVLAALTHARAFSLLGGGDTVTALLRLGFKEKEFSHVSLAGKALLQYLLGEKLAGLEALKK